MPLKAFKMPTTVPKRPTKRRRGTDGGERRKAALHFRVHDSDRALETALGGFDNFGVAHLLRSGLKFAQARGNDLGDMALLVALGDGDRFIQLPSFRAPATCCTNTRDCLRAALYIRARSIMTPME